MTNESYLLVPEANETSELRRVPVTFSAFPDGDTHCVIEDSKALQGKPVLIVHQLYPSQNEQIMRLLFLFDLLRDIGASSVSFFTPYLPYARQDKRHIDGESVSADTICRLLVSMGCAQFYTLDCHFMRGTQATKRNGLAINSFSLGPTLIDECRRQIGHNDFDVVGPDEGAAYLTVAHGAQNMRKERATYSALADGDSYRKISLLTSDHIQLAHRTVVVVDDMISTGSTLLRAIDNLREQGVDHVYCAATHGLFIGDSYAKIKARTDAIICSDSISHPFAVPLVENVLREHVIPAWLSV